MEVKNLEKKLFKIQLVKIYQKNEEFISFFIQINEDKSMEYYSSDEKFQNFRKIFNIIFPVEKKYDLKIQLSLKKKKKFLENDFFKYPFLKDLSDILKNNNDFENIIEEICQLNEFIQVSKVEEYFIDHKKNDSFEKVLTIEKYYVTDSHKVDYEYKNFEVVSDLKIDDNFENNITQMLQVVLNKKIELEKIESEKKIESNNKNIDDSEKKNENLFEKKNVKDSSVEVSDKDSKKGKKKAEDSNVENKKNFDKKVDSKKKN
jgi:hypothetical protein